MVVLLQCSLSAVCWLCNRANKVFDIFGDINSFVIIVTMNHLLFRTSGGTAVVLLLGVLFLLVASASARMSVPSRVDFSHLPQLVQSAQQCGSKLDLSTTAIVGPNSAIYNMIVLRNTSGARLAHAYWNVPKPPMMITDVHQRIEIAMSIFASSSPTNDTIDMILESVFVWTPIDKIWRMYSGYYGNGRYTFSKIENTTSDAIAECGIAHIIPHSAHTWGVVTSAHAARVDKSNTVEDFFDDMQRTFAMETQDDEDIIDRAAVASSKSSRKTDFKIRTHTQLLFKLPNIMYSRWIAFGIRSVKPLLNCAEYPSTNINFNDIIMDPAMRSAAEYTTSIVPSQCESVKISIPDQTEMDFIFA